MSDSDKQKRAVSLLILTKTLVKDLQICTDDKQGYHRRLRALAR